MAEPARLARVDIEAEGDTFTVTVTDETGGVFTLHATRDQLDQLADTLDDALLSEGEAD